MIAAFIFATFAFLLILGLPIALAIGLTSFIVLVTQDVPLVVIAQRMFAGTDSFPLVAVPFFILAGDLMAKGKISDRLVNFAESFLGFLRGGLWVVSVVAAMFFAGVTGIGRSGHGRYRGAFNPGIKKEKLPARLLGCPHRIGRDHWGGYPAVGADGALLLHCGPVDRKALPERFYSRNLNGPGLDRRGVTGSL